MSRRPTYDELLERLRRMERAEAKRRRAEDELARAREEQIRAQNAFFLNTINSLAHPFYVVDARDHTVVMANSAAWGDRPRRPTTCFELTHRRSEPCTDDDELCPLGEVKRTRKPVVVEHVHYDAEGKPRHVEVHGHPVFDGDGNVIQMIEYSLDVTERKRLERKLEALALQDELTRLYNRRGFLTLGEQHRKLASRTNKGISLLFADLDGMKRINDTLGHRVGDEALVETANVLRDTFRDSDVVARIGGDEFAVLSLQGAREDTEVLVERLRERLRNANARDGHPFRLSLSMGTAWSGPEEPRSLLEMLDQADRAMYSHKAAREGQAFAPPQVSAPAPEPDTPKRTPKHGPAKDPC